MFTDLSRPYLNRHQDLMDDPNVKARQAAVSGLFTVLSSYWELVPVARIKNFIETIVRTSAWDASSFEVRLCVVRVSSSKLELLLGLILCVILNVFVKNSFFCCCCCEYCVCCCCCCGYCCCCCCGCYCCLPMLLIAVESSHCRVS